MGNCAGQSRVALAALKMSVFGDLSPADQAALLEISVQDGYDGAFPSPLLKVRPAHCCYLVVTGKVVATVSRDSGQPSKLTVFEPGSIICILPDTTCTVEGAVLCGFNSIVYQKLHANQPAQVLAFERRKMEEFFATRPHYRTHYHSFFRPWSASTADLAALALFRSVSTDHIQLLVSTMKLSRRSADEGFTVLAQHSDRLSLQGLENVFIHNYSPCKKLLCARETTVGYSISTAHLRLLLAQNSVLRRLLRGNFYYSLLSERLGSLPFLQQLGEARLRALCRKVRIGSVSPGVYPQHQACCLIILEGKLRSEGRDHSQRIHRQHEMVNVENLLGNEHGGNGDGGGSAQLVTVVEPSLLLCMTSSALSEAFGHHRRDLALLLLQWTRTHIDLPHLLYIPEACRQLRRFLPLHELSSQPLLLYRAIVRLEALFLRLQSFTARCLSPQGWRRIAESYAEALIGSSEAFPSLLSPSARIPSGDGVNPRNDLRSPPNSLLRRSQASSELNLMASSILSSPSRSARQASRSHAVVDDDPQDLDQVLPENDAREPFLPGGIEDEEIAAEPPCSQFVASTQAQATLEQHMKELTDAVKLLFSAFQSKGRPFVTSLCAQETVRRANQFLKQPPGLSLALFLISLVRKHESSSSTSSVSTLTSYVNSLSHSPHPTRAPAQGMLPASHRVAASASASSPPLLPPASSSSTAITLEGIPTRAFSDQLIQDKEKNEWQETRYRICMAIQAMARNEDNSIDILVGVESVFALVKEETLDFLHKQAWRLWKESEDFASFVKQMLPMSTDDLQHALVAQDQLAHLSERLRREKVPSSGCLSWPGLCKRSAYIVPEN